jgi:hypothetical protein
MRKRKRCINKEIEMAVVSVDKNRDQVLEEAATSGNSL